jgi:hypothetical protein
MAFQSDVFCSSLKKRFGVERELSGVCNFITLHAVRKEARPFADRKTDYCFTAFEMTYFR